MKLQIKLVLMILISLNLYAQVLTAEQEKKLNSSVVKVVDNLFFIEEYNKISFIGKIFFDGQNTDKIIIKTEAKMKDEIVHKEQFLAITSTISDQIMQSIFMNPQYFNQMKSIELLTNQPNDTNLTIVLDFTEKGIDSTVINSQNKQNRFIPYSDLFYQKMQF